ncbi:M28 family metallopeptidase [Sphingomonas sp.]|jgi:hypothetical protein|uniref:M28 family metallopeptidase n=1 Tax=Sphingomonas sp. TaxID=28214 RepID=UPI002DE27BA9|nr:M28 family metallopeptidase [Sphingomonas sp.]
MILRPLLLASVLAAPANAQEFTPERFRSHVEFLATDLMEGRDAGTRGYDLAASYVGSQFLGLGLTPAGSYGWYQQVPFVEALRTGTASVSVGGRSFDAAKDVAVGGSPLATSQELTAPAVFVGYGLDAPAAGFDDYRGLDVRGKYVVVLSGFPKGTPSEVGAHLNSMKQRFAEQRGALGVITIRTLQDQQRRKFDYYLKSAAEPSIGWVQPDGMPYALAPKLRVTATFDQAPAEALFAGARTSLAAVLAEADKQGGKPKGFALKPSVTIINRSSHRRFTSPNVLGVLPGSDPALKDEYVLLMAHLDHEGTDPKLPGEDKIYNGAMDNATGISTMLEVARAFATSGTRPKRSFLFAAVTAEEDGLLGAEYLAKHPVVGKGKVVGVVNLDMPVLLYDFSDVIAFGANHSTLGPMVQRAASGEGVGLAADPLPQEGLFTRSDHYKFVREGVPSVFLMTGFGNGGDKQFTGFLSTHYHKVTDDLKLPIDWKAGAKFASINYAIAKEIADAPEAPRWNTDSFFNPAKK